MSGVPDKEFKITVKHAHRAQERNEQNENFNKEAENRRKYQIEVTELKNTIIELKNTLEGFKSRLDKVEEWISELKYNGIHPIRKTQIQNIVY